MAKDWTGQLKEVNFKCGVCRKSFTAVPDLIEDDPSAPHHPFRYSAHCPVCHTQHQPQASWERGLLKAHQTSTGPVTAEGKAASAANLDGQPWAWIVDKLLSEIATKAFRYPFVFDEIDEVPVLCVRTGHVMDHISQANNLREFWDGLPVKTAQVFKKQLIAAGVLLTDHKGPLDVERTVHSQRVAHMVCLSLPALEQFGLSAVVPKDGGLGAGPDMPVGYGKSRFGDDV